MAMDPVLNGLGNGDKLGDIASGSGVPACEPVEDEFEESTSEASSRPFFEISGSSVPGVTHGGEAIGNVWDTVGDGHGFCDAVREADDEICLAHIEASYAPRHDW